jgi:hypothetical protein
MIGEKFNTLMTGFMGAITLQVSHVALSEHVADIDVAAVSQTIVNILIGIVTLYKLLKPKKQDGN